MYTEFDPLQEVIVGDSYAPGDLDKLLPQQSISGFNKILEETAPQKPKKFVTSNPPTNLPIPGSFGL